MADSAIVLCGGRSTRMGVDKARLPFGPETLLARIVRLARDVTDDIVVVGQMSETLPGVKVVNDPVEGLGPLAGLATGLASIAHDRAVLLSCDAPLVVPALLQTLLEHCGQAEACVPLVDGMPMTTCAVYARRILPHVEELLAAGNRSLRALLATVDVQWVGSDALRPADPDLLSFLDCDTPEQYHAALARAGFASRTSGT